MTGEGGVREEEWKGKRSYATWDHLQMLLAASSSTKSIKFIPHPHPLDAPEPVAELARLGGPERADNESSPGYETLKHGVVGLIISIPFELRRVLGATDDAAEKIALESLD